jgi:hypothetical protein
MHLRLVGPVCNHLHHSDKHISSYTDLKSFTKLSEVLEDASVAAYTNAVQTLKNKEYVKTASSILATKARHAAFVASTVNEKQPWSDAFEVCLLYPVH